MVISKDQSGGLIIFRVQESEKHACRMAREKRVVGLFANCFITDREENEFVRQT